MNEASATVLRFKDVPIFRRGGGVVTAPLITAEVHRTAAFTTGITTFPVGKGAPLHSHNCDEQVTVLQGQAEATIEGVRVTLGPMDTTYIPAHRSHSFTNAGNEPLAILWIYASDHVTRTFTDSGLTVEHLSNGDTVD